MVSMSAKALIFMFEAYRLRLEEVLHGVHMHLGSDARLLPASNRLAKSLEYLIRSHVSTVENWLMFTLSIAPQLTLTIKVRRIYGCCNLQVRKRHDIG